MSTNITRESECPDLDFVRKVLKVRRRSHDNQGIMIDVALHSYERWLRAAGRSEETIRSYRNSVRAFSAFVGPIPVTEVTRTHMQDWLMELDGTTSGTTAQTRLGGVRSFFSWLVDEEEIDVSPVARVRGPKGKPKEPDVLTDQQLKRLLAAAKSSRRDTAILWLFISTPCRAGELRGLKLTDVDLDTKVLHVTGKGQKKREVPFSNKAALALDRYIRVQRSRMEYNHLPWLWLGTRGRLVDIWRVVDRLSKRAGVGHVHPHEFRHTFADKWLDEDGWNGREVDLMRLAGWESRAMLERYTRKRADKRAQAAYRRVAPGDSL